jgi:hypothetical protein
MITPDISPPSTVTECSHGLKVYAKKWWEENKHTKVDWNCKQDEFVPDTVLQGLWKWHEKTHGTGASLRDLPQEPS